MQEEQDEMGDRRRMRWRRRRRENVLGDSIGTYLGTACCSMTGQRCSLGNRLQSLLWLTLCLIKHEDSGVYFGEP